MVIYSPDAPGYSSQTYEWDLGRWGMTARTAAAPGARGKRVKTHARSPPRRETLRPALPSSTCLARFAKRSVACVSEADATVGEGPHLDHEHVSLRLHGRGLAARRI